MTILLACDLDNTLIHSFRHKQEGEICIEWIGEKEQSYMTARTCAALLRLDSSIELVPVTSRSIEQYHRIVWPDRSPRYALVANGGILLKDGQIDPDWLEETKKEICLYTGAFRQISEFFQHAEGIKSCRMVNDVYLFAHFFDESSAEKAVESNKGRTPLAIVRTRRKVYLHSPIVDKGAALHRLKTIFPVEQTIAAGDSEPDLSMLDAADLAIVPGELLAAHLDKSRIHVCPKETAFSDFILQTVSTCLKPPY